MEFAELMSHCESTLAPVPAEGQFAAGILMGFKGAVCNIV